jgi:hypothetical protein
VAVLTGGNATGIPAIDEFAFGRWPHLFTILATRYQVPDHFLIVLLFLWEATVGHNTEGMGDLAIAQIPVREREARKWLAALCALGFFERVQGPPGSTTGAMFIYKKATTPDAWEQLFAIAGQLSCLRNWDKVSPERFARVVARAMGIDVAYTPEPEEDEATKPKTIKELLRRYPWLNGG